MGSMRMAKATPEDIKELSDYLAKAEKRNARDFPHGWRRVIWGCDILIEQCCDPALDYLSLKPELLNKPEPASQTVDKEFLQFVTNARNQFCLHMDEHDWSTEMRTAAESLLIAYDQMKERLRGSDAVEDWISVESGSPDCHRIDGKKKYINWVLGTNGKSQFVCVYTKGHELEYGDDDPSDEEYDEVEERNGCLYLKPGWYELEETPGGQYDETWVKRKVTHYRPLPQPPKQQ